MTKYWLLPFLLLLAACGGNVENKKELGSLATDTNVTSLTASGMQKLSVPNRQGETFGLFTPTKVSSKQLILFFDPEGNADKPINLYRAIAEEKGWIMACSHQIQNGLALDSVQKMATALIDHLIAKTSTDSIILFGFSGGAKGALLTGTLHPKVKAVVFCGAALPVEPNHFLSLIGIAGERDMNYADMVQFDQYLKGSNIFHYAIHWDGKHEYPTPQLLHEAINLAESKKADIKKTPRANLTPAELLLEQETKYKYYQAFSDKNLAWWRSETQQLKQKAKEELMYERVLGFISLACYNYAGRAYDTKDPEMAKYILQIYEWADSLNPDLKMYKQKFEFRY